MLSFYFICFICFLSKIQAFNVINRPTIYKSDNLISKKEDKFTSIIKPLLDDGDTPSNILFFTSVSNLIPSFVYDNFVTKLSKKYDNNVLIPKSIKDIKKLPSTEDLTVISHASGAIEALKFSKNKNVKNLVLIDPVDNRIENLINKKKEKKNNWLEDDTNPLDSSQSEDPIYDLDNVEKVLLFYTQKSYNWKEKEDSTWLKLVNPFLNFNSFIPEKISIKPSYLRIKECDHDKCDIDDCKCKLVLKVLNYGLCDILDDEYSNFMHNTICEGHPNRSDINLDDYHSKLALIINLFIKHEYLDYKEYLDDLEDFKLIDLKEN